MQILSKLPYNLAAVYELHVFRTHVKEFILLSPQLLCLNPSQPPFVSPKISPLLIQVCYPLI